MLDWGYPNNTGYENGFLKMPNSLPICSLMCITTLKVYMCKLQVVASLEVMSLPLEILCQEVKLLLENHWKGLL